VSGRSEAPGARSFDALWSALLPVGRDRRTGGYRRSAWTPADLECREWFRAAAAERGLDVETDRNGNLWAWQWPDGWTGDPVGAVVTGSHLDSVPDGGAYDGPLGVVSAFAAVDVLRLRGVRPIRPLGVVAFADEEGARFGVACAGSRLSTGALDPDRARGLRDPDGVTLAEAVRAAGLDPAALGPVPGLARRVSLVVELHVEQGRALVERGVPVGVASGIWSHGRWRCTVRGAADHAGTTRLADRRDPMLAAAELVLRARSCAASGALATVGRLEVEPGATNAVPSTVRAWLDARAPSEAGLDALVQEVLAGVQARGVREGTPVEVSEESRSRPVDFPAGPRERICAVLRGVPGLADPGGDVPVLATGAGHDAGVLAARVPAAMLFVRNPTGVSHAPGEHAERDDCLVGVDALAAVLADAVTGPLLPLVPAPGGPDVPA